LSHSCHVCAILVSQSTRMLSPDQHTLEAQMSPFEEAITDHAEIVNWVSKQHGCIPHTDLELLMGLPPLELNDDEDNDFDWP
ncbi:MAG: hypothetical protein R8K50_08285, partial [Mariprofundus sp.]